jgi:hypothetical protein
LKAKQPDERLAYAIARCDWIDFWKRQHAHLTKFCCYASDEGRENPDCKECKHSTGKPCAYLGIRGIRSLDSEINENGENNTTLGELIVGEADYEARLNGQLDAHIIEAKLKLYPAINNLVNKRLVGLTLTRKETETLETWVSKYGVSLLLN